MSAVRLLRILRIFYQGLRLITGGLKKEIAALEKELDEAGERPTGQNKMEIIKLNNTQQS